MSTAASLAWARASEPAKFSVRVSPALLVLAAALDELDAPLELAFPLSDEPQAARARVVLAHRARTPVRRLGARRAEERGVPNRFIKSLRVVVRGLGPSLLVLRAKGVGFYQRALPVISYYRLGLGWVNSSRVKLPGYSVVTYGDKNSFVQK